MSLHPINRIPESSSVFEPARIHVNRVDPYEGSSMQPCERTECSDACVDVVRIIASIIVFPFVLVFAIIITPFMLLYRWITDPLPKEIPLPEYSEELLKIGLDYHINPERKKDRPKPLDLDVDLMAIEGAGRIIQMQELAVCFDEVFGEFKGTGNSFGGKGVFVAKEDDEFAGSNAALQETGLSMKECIQRYINFINDGVWSKQNDIYFLSLERIVQNIIVQLEKRETDPEKQEGDIDRKRRALVELAEASTHCLPRRYEEASRQYRKLVKKEETFENLCLIWLQEFKEELILEAYQGAPWAQFHVLNHARKEVGDEYGLENQLTLLDQDVFATINSRSPEEYRSLLDAHYRTESIVHVISTKLETEGRNDEVNKYLQELCTADVIKIEDLDELYTDYVDDKGKSKPKMTCEGIAILLNNLGFLQKN